MDHTKDDLITVDLTDMGTLDPYYGAMPNVYISPNTSPDFGTLTIGKPVWPDRSGTLSLKGEDADIDINGVSLMETLRGIQERLNILTPDPDMEQEWSELADIRQQYEAKLAECRSKSRAWKALQS